MHRYCCYIDCCYFPNYTDSVGFDRNYFGRILGCFGSFADGMPADSVVLEVAAKNANKTHSDCD